MRRKGVGRDGILIRVKDRGIKDDALRYAAGADDEVAGSQFMQAALPGAAIIPAAAACQDDAVAVRAHVIQDADVGAAMPVNDAYARQMVDLQIRKRGGTGVGAAAAAQKADLIVTHVSQRSEMSDLKGIGLVAVAFADIASGVDRVGKDGEQASATA